MADGSLHVLSLVEETEYGVVPANPQFIKQRILGTTIGLSKNTLQSEEIREDRMPGDTRHGSRQVGGDINHELSYGTWHKMWEALLGGTWEADTPALGTDQLKGGTTRRSFSALREFKDLPVGQDSFFLYTGIEFTTLALTITADAIATGVATVVGKDQVIQASAPTGTNYTERTTTKVLDTFTGSIEEGGTSIGTVTEATFTIENNIEPRFVVGSKTTIRPSIKRLTVTGQVTVYFESSDLMKKFINEEDTTIFLDLVDLDGNTETIGIPRAIYTGGQPDVSGDGPITLAMPFTANFDAASSTNILMRRTPA